MSMSVLRDTFWMAGSTALRLLSGLILFVVLARVLGVSEFGNLTMWFAVAALLALPTNFGLSIYLLREVPLSDDRGATLMVDALLLKGFIACLTLSILALAPVAIDFDARILWPLAITHLVDSFTELLCAQLRAGNAFKAETNFVTRQAIVQFVIVCLVAWGWPSSECVAWAFAFSRAVSLLIISFGVRNEFNDVVLPKPQILRAFKLMRRARSYFADFGVQSTLIQIDVILLGHFAGPTAVGIYQAAMRVAHGVSQAITVLVNVALPRLSRRLIHRPLDTDLALKVLGIFFIAGTTVSFPLYVAADFFANLLYGDGYVGVSAVFKIIAVFLLIRFTGAAAGVLLIATGDQGKRAVVMLLAIICLGALSVFYMPRFGAVGAAIAMSVTYAVIALALSLLVVLRIRGRPTLTELNR